MRKKKEEAKYLQSGEATEEEVAPKKRFFTNGRWKNEHPLSTTTTTQGSKRERATDRYN